MRTCGRKKSSFVLFTFFGETFLMNGTYLICFFFIKLDDRTFGGFHMFHHTASSLKFRCSVIAFVRNSFTHSQVATGDFKLWFTRHAAKADVTDVEVCNLFYLKVAHSFIHFLCFFCAEFFSEFSIKFKSFQNFWDTNFYRFSTFPQYHSRATSRSKVFQFICLCKSIVCSQFDSRDCIVYFIG